MEVAQGCCGAFKGLGFRGLGQGFRAEALGCNVLGPRTLVKTSMPS